MDGSQVPGPRLVLNLFLFFEKFFPREEKIIFPGKLLKQTWDLGPGTNRPFFSPECQYLFVVVVCWTELLAGLAPK